jgi:hypothetical protein
MQWTEAGDAMDGKERCNGWKEAMQWTERSGSGANVSVLPQCHFMFFPVNSTDDTKNICEIILYCHQLFVSLQPNSNLLRSFHRLIICCVARHFANAL